MSAEKPQPTAPRQPWDGGGTAMMAFAVLGVAGLAATAARAFMGEGGKKVALYAYLLGFAYWLGLALAALVLIMIFHASKARWITVIRRVIEAFASTLPLFALLFIPIVIWMKDIFPWAGSLDGLDEETVALIHFRHIYLNPTFFIIRALFYFVVWVGLAETFLRWSTRQDETGAPELTAKAYWLGPAGLPFMGIALTWAAIDWLQSIGTRWFSSVWGVYYFAGSVVACFSLIVICTMYLSRGPLAGTLKTPHWLSLGKFMLAFVCFWGYIAFSQWMLNWIANIPDTTPWMLVRSAGGWQYIKYLLIVGHFGAPFLILLQRWVKYRPERLAVIGFWILFIHAVDLYWVVMPEVLPAQAIPDWSNFAAWIGVGGVAIAFGIFRLRGRYALPVKDPYLADSLAYSRMM